jgi:hypothetical protein
VGIDCHAERSGASILRHAYLHKSFAIAQNHKGAKKNDKKNLVIFKI